MKEVIIVSASEGIMLRGLESRLKDRGVEVQFVGVSSEKLSLTVDRTGIYIVSVQNDLSSVAPAFNQIREYAIEKGIPIMVLADRQDQTEIRKLYLEFSPVVETWLERDINTDELAATIRKELLEEKSMSERKNILIVDDDPTYAKMVREWLKDSYHVSVVVNAMQAIAFMSKHPIDLVLLDYEMPVVSGPQVLEMMRAEPETAS
ncbi:MAG: response regulator, partial [Butyrivibrio sp.]|nr:response regulator [Butyrivibrio sp.]